MKYETLPHIGVTGKFYCQGDVLGPKCYCCNGKCGPTNGENCVKCMQLDMTRRGLPKGYLIHANGQVCWLDNNQHFNCGLMYSIERKACGKEGYCKWCHNLQKTMNRYENLMWDTVSHKSLFDFTFPSCCFESFVMIELKADDLTYLKMDRFNYWIRILILLISAYTFFRILKTIHSLLNDLVILIISYW